MQPFKNKTAYDPGRFRYKITFYEQVSTPDGYGGTTVTLTQVLETYAVREKLREGSQLALEAGASVLNSDCYFVIRYRAAFTPKKDMNLVCDGIYYTIRAIIEIDVPVNYYKLLCVQTTT